MTPDPKCDENTHKGEDTDPSDYPRVSALWWAFFPFSYPMAC